MDERDPFVSQNQAEQPALPAKFTWPPRPVVVDSMAASGPAIQVRAIDPGNLAAPERIRARREVKNGEGGGGTAVLQEEPRSWWGHVERVWMDVAAPPLVQRAAEAGWVPEQPGDYCSRCGRSIAEGGGGDAGGCGACRQSRFPWDRFVRLGRYQPPLSRWIQDVKFTRWRRLGWDLGRMLGEAVARESEGSQGADLACLPQGPPAIVPVSMSLRRRLVRGIDHTRIIANGLAPVVGGHVVPALHRQHRPSQLQVPTSLRSDNVKGAFRLRTGAVPRLVGRWIVLVDDVSTTGATLRAAAKAVREGVKRYEQAGGREAVRVEEASGLGGKNRVGRQTVIWVAVVACTEADADDRLMA